MCRVLKQIKYALLIILLAAPLLCFSQNIIISEFIAVNSTGIQDEDGDRSDWIELYNAGSEAVNLGGWHLTDKADDLTKWTFYPTILNPGEFRIVFASNKNRKDPGDELHSNFKLSGSGEYLALVNSDGVVVSDFSPEYPAQVDDVSYGFAGGLISNVVVTSSSPCTAIVPFDDSMALDWTYSNFDDSSWTTGVASVGYETKRIEDHATSYDNLIQLDVGSTMDDINTTIYIRIPFVVPEEFSVDRALLRIRYDDGFRVYINGQPIADANITGSYTWNEEALGYVESTDYVSYDLSSVGAFQTGTNVLAIQGVNDKINSSDFLIMPELTIFSSSEISTNGTFYFQEATPGSGNHGGTENIGPQYSKEQHLPLQPLESDDLNISVKVIDDADEVTSVSMTYQIMYTNAVTVPMFDDGLHGDGAAGDSIYGASISATNYNAGEMIRYRFTAEDGAGNTSRWPLFYDPLNSPEFFGTMAQVDIPSSMPVYHWFIDDSIYEPDTGNESRSSIFYNGVLYDNIMTRTRGGSTENAAILKKSHKFDFNRGSHFEYDLAERKIEEMNLNTTYSDKTYLRRMLAWNSYAKAGAPGCKAFLVHLRRNNEFFGVQNFEEQLDKDYLRRHDYDENGKLYKIIGWGDDEVDTGYKTHRVAQKTRKEDTDSSDVHALIHGIQTPEKESFIFDNMDVANVLNYVCLTTLMKDGDTAAKNHYLYTDTDGTGDWTIFPWDKDLAFGMNWDQGITHDNCAPANNLRYPSWALYQKAIWDSPVLKELYLRRLRTVLDELLQPASTPQADRYYENMIQELLSIHDADLMQDYNKWGNPWYGTDYTQGAANTNWTINTYLNPSRTYFYSQALLPEAQTNSPAIQISYVEMTPASGNQAEEYIELYNPNDVAVDISGWSVSNAVEHVLRSGSVIPPNGTFYLSPNTRAFRQRATSPKGGERLFVQGPYKGMLSSRGETLDLYDPAGVLRDSETWSADISDAQDSLRISEVMYNPALPNGSDLTEDRLEFVELVNTGTSPLDISGTFFTAGLLFTNPAVVLPAGGYLVIASDPVEFATQYNTNGMTVIGPFSGYLSNGSDAIELEDSRGETIQRFEYKDSWYKNTDGDGFSLTLIDPANTNSAVWNDKVSWRPSLNPGGSPGTGDIDHIPGSIIINEILAHSDTGGDWVELKNMTAADIDISHWFISDDKSDFQKYQIPNNTTLPANGVMLIHEADFNSGSKAFALSELGDELILNRALSDGTLQGYQTSREFDASGKDISLGRWIDSEGDEQFIAMAEQTPGVENSGPRTGPVLISEIMYLPDSGKAEFIELYNSSNESVTLYDLEYPTNSWSLTGAISYTFPAGTTLGSGEFLLVCSTNPVAFRTSSMIPEDVQVFGPFFGNLDNQGERLKFYRPGNPEPLFVPQILIESVNYKPAIPWPVLAAPGQSIERVSAIDPANDPASWRAGPGTPGVSILTSVIGQALSSAWKARYFGTPAPPASGEYDDFDQDGHSNLSEYIAGTNPTNSLDVAKLNIQTLPNGNIVLSIQTRETDPVSDFGAKRFYTFEQQNNLRSNQWSVVSEATDVVGNGQIIKWEQSPNEATVFTRASIELK